MYFLALRSSRSGERSGMSGMWVWANSIIKSRGDRQQQGDVQWLPVRTLLLLQSISPLSQARVLPGVFMHNSGKERQKFTSFLHQWVTEQALSWSPVNKHRLDTILSAAQLLFAKSGKTFVTIVNRKSGKPHWDTSI